MHGMSSACLFYLTVHISQLALVILVCTVAICEP